MTTYGAAGIGETLGRVSVNDAKELLTALLTAPDHSSSLAGMMSTRVYRCSTGRRQHLHARYSTRTYAGNLYRILPLVQSVRTRFGGRANMIHMRRSFFGFSRTKRQRLMGETTQLPARVKITPLARAPARSTGSGRKRQ